MTNHSFAKRYRDSLLGARSSPSRLPSERVRSGYSLWHRYWTSLLGFRLRQPATEKLPQPEQAAARASRWRLETARAARAELQDTTDADGSTLPAVGRGDLEARVHQTALAIPYIHRDEEDTMRALLRAGRPVLLIGSSMVGKTKMAARVIAEEFESWPVVIPASKTALVDLAAWDASLHNTVIWLDDIDRLIGAGGITDRALRRLAAAGNVIAGTIRAGAYERFRPSDQLRLPEWDVLNAFEHIFISRDLTEREQQQLAGAVDDPDIRDRIRTVGLGEYVGTAGQVAEIGYTTDVTYHRTETAIKALRKAVSSGHADAAPMAAYSLGVLLAGQGDVEGAKAAYQRAIDSGHADAAPMAAFHLGLLLVSPQDASGAEAASEPSIGSGHAELREKAPEIYELWIELARKKAETESYVQSAQYEVHARIARTGRLWTLGALGLVLIFSAYLASFGGAAVYVAGIVAAIDLIFMLGLFLGFRPELTAKARRANVRGIPHTKDNNASKQDSIKLEQNFD